MIVLGVSFFLFYKYLAPGILIIKGDQKGFKVEIGNKTYEKVKKSKILFLKPGSYVLLVAKDGFRENQELVSIKPLRRTKFEVFFNKMNYIQALSASDLDIISLSSYKDNNLIYLNQNDNSFYKANLDSVNFTIASGMGEKIDIDLGIGDGKVNNVKYSPSKNEAFVLLTDAEGNNITKLVNFDNKNVNTLNINIEDIDWVTDDRAAAIVSDSGLKLMTFSPTGFNQKKIVDIPGDIASITKTANSSKVLVGFSENNLDRVAFVDLNSGQMSITEISEGLVSAVISSPKDEKAIVYAYSNSPKTYLISSEGQYNELSINPYFGTLVWNPNGQEVIYPELKKNNYEFQAYNVSDNKIRILEKYPSLEGDPSNLIVNNNFVDFIVGQAIVGFKLE